MPSAPCFVNPKLYGKQKYFSEFSGERKHAEPLLFQPVPSGAALPPGNAASCFPAAPELPGKKSAASFFSWLPGKEKRTLINRISVPRILYALNFTPCRRTLPPAPQPAHTRPRNHRRLWPRVNGSRRPGPHGDGLRSGRLFQGRYPARSSPCPAGPGRNPPLSCRLPRPADDRR